MTQSKSPLVSVIMNCFNGEKYLKEALISLFEQNYKNWELIFWDNQSSDSSREIIDSYDDDRIKYFYAQNHTALGDARNLALGQASGDWIGFLDVDDLWFPDKLSKQIESISKANSNVSLCYSRCEFFTDIIQIDYSVKRISEIRPSYKKLPQDDLAEELYFGNIIPFPSLLLKKEALSQIGGIPPYRFSPDYYMSLAISNKFEALAIDEILCAYRMHNSNLSSQIKEEGYIEAIQIVSDLAPSDQSNYLIRYNTIRYIFFLLRELRIYDAMKEVMSLGIIGFNIGLFKFTNHLWRHSREK